MRRRTVIFPILILSAACSRAPRLANDVEVVPAAKLSLDPNDAVWRNAPVHVAKLLLQDLVEPRLMKPSTAEVRVQAVTSGNEVAFRLNWVDATKSDQGGPARMVDSCAVQLPRKTEKDSPAPQMGEAARGVEITMWRADWQAYVTGRGDTIRDVYPNAAVDHYPFEAQSLAPGSAAQAEMARRYAPAAASGNRRVGPRKTPVEDLLANGPGSLSPNPAGTSNGRGERTKDGWSVVIQRRLPEGVSAKVRSQVAFAVWEGSQQETGARKMRTGWIPLSLKEASK
jgi:DMSO reductase family type II enzyme heme b subunit